MKDLKLKENEVVHCKTEKQANKVLKIAHELGYKWSNYESFLDVNNYEDYKEKTCYDILNGKYSPKKYFIKYEDKKVITAKEFLKRHKETKKGKLTIVVSNNYKELYEDNLALVNHILLDTVKNDKEWIERVQKSNLNITLYTDKNYTELFKKSFGKFEIKLMDCEVNISPLSKTAIVRKEELVSGWYKYEGTKYLMYHNFETNTKFGFNTIGEWRNILNNVKDNTKYIKADIKEIEERLKEEAVKRGFKEGVKVRNHQRGDRELINFSLENIKYSEKYHIGIYLTTGTGTWLMMDGVWAEIVEEKLTLENIQVDCSELTTEQIEEMKRVVVDNKFISDSDKKSIEEYYVEHREQSFSEKCEQDYKDVCKAYGISEEDAKPKGLRISYLDCFDRLPSHVLDTLKFRTPQGRSMLKVDSNQVNTTFNPQSHYNNEFGSLYKMSEQLGLNTYEFDILKRVVRCRKKGQFEEDLQKTKDLIDLYLIESKK